jgi:hypothetical protein
MGYFREGRCFNSIFKGCQFLPNIPYCIHTAAVSYRKAVFVDSKDLSDSPV